ncbi:rhomboid family intramembrane serine protease [Sphingorhabdus pulchriflava]|uniref:Rhomboid family intramembrane serine protease n=1 Tax=Sphingorhabdus pulchriflava TaxID=2292257 RepID=A0A371BJD0_9SPHN|nr:rhomboid family intramembrane serine protease [Sphingorhabdus pulchriflava]RDV07676.1 rhomboid family intramembrane serine protease [Sphingorhabdus pulchriflava]
MAKRISVLAAICALMIALHILNLALGGALLSFGIDPRNAESAYTIFTAPWLHADFGHLFGNLASFIVLAAICLLNGIRYFLKASLLIIMITGALVWLLARDNIHIGASGWIFGLWSLVIALAWFDRSWRNIAISLAVTFFYGGMVFGVLPVDSYISFESHLFGALSGVIAAALLSKEPRQLASSVQNTGELKFWS